MKLGKASKFMEVKKQSIKIRPVKSSDVADLYKLSRHIKEISGSETMDHYTQKEIAAWVREKDKVWLAAEAGQGGKKELVGFLFAIFISHDWCMVEGLGVKKAYRRQGVGTLLLSEINKIGKQRKINFIQAYTNSKDKIAQNFWRKHGFKKGKIFYWFDKKL